MALEHQRAAEPGPRREDEPTVFRQAADGGLDGDRVVVYPVADSAEVAHVDAAALTLRPETDLPFPGLAAHCKAIRRIRLETIQGEDVSVTFILLPIIQEDFEFLRGEIGFAVFKLKTGRAHAGEKKLHIHHNQCLFAFCFVSASISRRMRFMVMNSRSKAV